MIGLLDTNVALYLLADRLAQPLPVGRYGISIITEMELLSWPSLTADEERKVQQFLRHLTLLELTPTIRAHAVKLRKDHRLKLPDAVVCATALASNVDLWTNDKALGKVPGLTCQSVTLRAGVA